MVSCGVNFPESKIAHEYLDQFDSGLEIGGSQHNQWGLPTKNCGHSTEGTAYAAEETKLAGSALPVDVVCDGDSLPFPENSQNFVVASHVLEHFFDPIKALKEWLRVVKPYGYVFVIFPHKERTFDKDRPRTPLLELIERHAMPPEGRPTEDKHWTVWITEDSVNLCKFMGLHVVRVEDVDDKCGNGFTFILQKQ